MPFGFLTGALCSPFFAVDKMNGLIGKQQENSDQKLMKKFT
jgi:hypothetical protein